MSYEMAFINKGYETNKKKRASESDREFWKSLNQRESDFMVATE